MGVYYKVDNDGEQESYQEFKHFLSISAFLHTFSLFSWPSVFPALSTMAAVTLELAY